MRRYPHRHATVFAQAPKSCRWPASSVRHGLLRVRFFGCRKFFARVRVFRPCPAMIRRSCVGDKWALVWPEGTSTSTLKAAWQSIEQCRAGRRQSAVFSTQRAFSERAIRLQWRQPCTYNSAYAWVGNALARDAKAQWELQLVNQPQTSPSASKRPREEPDPPCQGDEADGGCVVRRESSAATAASSRSEAPAMAVYPASPPSPGHMAAHVTKTWLLVKALELKRGAHMAGSAVLCSTYSQTEKIGEGTFGEVWRASNTVTGAAVVVKHLKRTCWEAFLAEVAILARITHPNVISLLDVLVAARYSLVFGDAGESLATWLRGQPAPVPGWRRVLVQVLAGVAYLHALLVLHADLKPHNICIDGTGQVRVCDLGAAVIVLPGFRNERREADIVREGLPYGTLWFRSLEILCGDKAFSLPADCWAIGVIWAQMLRQTPLFKEHTSIGMIIAITCTLGSPSGCCLQYYEALPLWSCQLPLFARGRLHDILRDTLSQPDMEVMTGLLRLSPAVRLEAAAALRMLSQEVVSTEVVSTDLVASTESARSTVTLGVSDPTCGTVAPTGMLLQLAVDSHTIFYGKRGHFNMREGVVQAELLSWLRADPTFCGPPATGPLSLEAPSRAKCERVEAGCKLEIAGHMGDGEARPGLTLNGLDASQPNWERLRAFAQAFKRKNDKALRQIQSEYRRILRKMASKDRGVNGDAFLHDDILDWAFDLGTVQLISAGDRREPLHFDGGASFLHIGLTLYGARTIHFKTVRGPPLQITCTPGHMYFGCLSCAAHWVQHTSDTRDLHVHEDVGPVSVVVLWRSRIFRGSRASAGASGPNPHAVFRAALKAVRGGMAQDSWLLPSVADCVDVLSLPGGRIKVGGVFFVSLPVFRILDRVRLVVESS